MLVVLPWQSDFKTILQVFSILSSAAEARLLSRHESRYKASEMMVIGGWWIHQVVLSSRPVAMANRIVARTAVRFGVQDLSSVDVFPPR